jgi:hypothetical protein
VPILAAPYAPPDTAALVDWSGIDSMTWTGHDGTVWDLTGWTGGVSLQAGARGFTMPPLDRFANASAALPGSHWRGWRAQDREVFWPVRVFSDAGSQAWVEYDRAFWATMRPDKVGVWQVVQLSGEARRLSLRFVDDGQAAFATLPALVGWTVYGITLVAEQPFWEGDTIARTWAVDDPTPFFGGVANGSGPTFYISSGSQVTNAQISNPGDVDTYPIYTAVGPFTSLSVGYAGNLVTLGSVASGQTRIVDTRPDHLTVVDQNGVDKWSELGSSAQFGAPIPPGDPVPLSLSMVGAGSITASITPRFYRAW